MIDPMSEPTTEPTPSGPGLDEQILTASIGALELFGVYLGDRLGLYEALRAERSMAPPELAAAAGIDARYAREWLEQQAVAGVLHVVVEDANGGGDPDRRRFALPEAHIGAVADPTSLEHLAPLARMIVGVAKALDDVVDAYRTGGGVPFARYGADLRAGQGAVNRPAFTTALVEEWLPAAGDLVDRLQRGGRIADLGCGLGWSSVAIAKAFPDADVWGVDADVASIEDARAIATEHGADVRFLAADASELAGHGPFDAVTILEALHDMAQPVAVLRAAREALGDGGVVIVADEAVAESFTAPGDEIERMMYGWSIVHCLPACRTEEPSAAIGTVIRESTVRALAADAGFSSCEVLPVDGGFFRLYRLAV